MLQIRERRSINLTPISLLVQSQEVRSRSVVVLCRFGGGDSCSSFVMEGLVDYLLEGLEF